MARPAASTATNAPVPRDRELHDNLQAGSTTDLFAKEVGQTLPTT